MVTNEREMVKKDEAAVPAVERFTSLQPTYEDTVAPEREWELEEDFE